MKEKKKKKIKFIPCSEFEQTYTFSRTNRYATYRQRISKK